MDAALDDLALAEKLGQALQARGWMLATAESCTGGWVAQVVTSVSGSSAWFDRGFITYSNRAKVEMLGVDSALLARAGAVSEATAGAMAEGALAHSPAQLALAVTGIAGPGGGSPEKPVGMVCIVWAARAREVQAMTYYFSGDRQAVRQQSVEAALQGALRYLQSL